MTYAWSFSPGKNNGAGVMGGDAVGVEDGDDVGVDVGDDAGNGVGTGVGAAVGNGVCTSKLPILMPMPCLASSLI